MHTQESVAQQIAQLEKPYIFWTKREISALPEILNNDEKIVALTSGMMKNRTWLLICTDRRMIFLNHNMFLGAQQIQMPLDRIQSVNHDFVIAVGTIRVSDGDTVISLGMILQPAIVPFVKATQNAIHDYKKKIMESARTPHSNTPQPSANNVIEQIEKLAMLKEKGYITELEFQQQKKRVLEA